MVTTVADQQPIVASSARRLRFHRILVSEWIKLWSLRSTYWLVLGTIVAMVMIAVVLGAMSVTGMEGGGPGGRAALEMGYSFAQLTVAVLGVLIITGEYTTGTIRPTFAAVPTRLPVLLAKATLVGGMSFVLGILGVGVAYAISSPLFDQATAADLSDPAVWRIFWGTGLYLAAVAMFGLAIGAVIRNTAGAVTAVLGTPFILSTVWQLLMTDTNWFTTTYPYLPFVAGEQIILPAATADEMQLLAPWSGFGVFMIYIVVAYLAAAVLLRRKDA